jgi:hypothetical protein
MVSPPSIKKKFLMACKYSINLNEEKISDRNLLSYEVGFLTSARYVHCYV